MSNFTKGATYRTAAAQPDMSTRVIEPTAPAIIPLPSDAPAETIARLSVELAASQAQVARMREALWEVPALDESAFLCGRANGGLVDGAKAAQERCTAILDRCAAARKSAPDDIAIPRERYERMVEALGMVARLVSVTNDLRNEQELGDDPEAERETRVEQERILAAMDAAGKA